MKIKVPYLNRELDIINRILYIFFNSSFKVNMLRSR